MTPRRIYYINYIDPRTGFLKREESENHKDIETRKAELKKRGVLHIAEGSFETETT